MSFRATTEQLQPEALSVMVFQMVYAIMRWHHLNLHVHDCMGAWPMLVPPMNDLDDTYQQNVQQQLSDATFNSKYQVHRCHPYSTMIAGYAKAWRTACKHCMVVLAPCFHSTDGGHKLSET